MASRGDIDKNALQPSLYEGWQLRSFDSCLIKTGVYKKLNTKEYNTEGKYPVIDQGENFISGYIDDENLLYNGEIPVVIFGDHTRNVKYIDFKFAIGADGTKVLRPIALLNEKFFYYYLKSIKVPSLGYSRHFAVLKLIDVPIPAYEEQEKIVDKLNGFFNILENIQIALDSVKSLNVRYFEKCLINPATLRYYPPQKLAGYLTEKTQRIGQLWQGLKKVGVSAKKGIIDLDVGQKQSFEKYKIVKPGDFVYNAMRINIGSIAQYTGSDIAITSPDYIVFKVSEHLSPNLLIAYLKSPMGLMEINSNTKGSVRSRLYFKNLANINYPVAPLKVQQQAEMMLNWFSTTRNYYENNMHNRLQSLSKSVLEKAFKNQLIIIRTDQDKQV